MAVNPFFKLSLRIFGASSRREQCQSARAAAIALPLRGWYDAIDGRRTSVSRL
jgi:hypothetical protein